jgi:hypothetical protein
MLNETRFLHWLREPEQVVRLASSRSIDSGDRALDQEGICLPGPEAIGRVSGRVEELGGTLEAGGFFGRLAISRRRRRQA